MSSELNKKLTAIIQKVAPRIIAVRRTIHQNPELSGSEFATARTIRTELASRSIKSTLHLNKTAVLATLRNGPGKTVVLRADTDALPIGELTSLPFASRNNGIMHACGHDMHTAILIGAAETLIALKTFWQGTVVLLFQPSEEMEPGGAKQLIDAGIYPADKASAVFGLHVSTDHTTGSVGLRSGIDYAGLLGFEANINGKGGHGATPEATIDPIVAAASMISQLQALVSRETSPFTPAVLTVGTIHAGSRRNIIPDSATFQGTVRCHSRATLDHIEQRIGKMLSATAGAFRASLTCSFEKSYPPSFNDPHITAQYAAAITNYLGNKKVIIRENPTMLAEDFAYYQEKTPGLYIHLGVRQPGKNRFNGWSIHSAQFQPDEAAIATGIGSHVIFALDQLT